MLPSRLSLYRQMSAPIKHNLRVHRQGLWLVNATLARLPRALARANPHKSYPDVVSPSGFLNSLFFFSAGPMDSPRRCFVPAVRVFTKYPGGGYSLTRDPVAFVVYYYDHPQTVNQTGVFDKLKRHSAQGGTGSSWRPGTVTGLRAPRRRASVQSQPPQGHPDVSPSPWMAVVPVRA